MPFHLYALGIDLGGTNAKTLAITRTGRVLAHASAPCGPAQRAWKGAVRQAVAAIRQQVQGPLSRIGVAAPGLPSADGRSIAIMPGRLRGLEGLVWRSFLHAAIDVPVLNDAQAALVGETWLGAARGSRNAILLTLGTGVGGAAMVDGRVLRGHIGRAGHLGHMSLDPDGAPDVTGAPGSLEDAIGDWTVPARTGGR